MIPGGKRPLEHAPILIGAILIGAVLGLIVVTSPGTDVESVSPSNRADAIERALLEALGSGAARIEPTVEAGTVRLRGQVASEATRARAVATVLALEGVSEVEDELHVPEPPDAPDAR